MNQSTLKPLSFLQDRRGKLSEKRLWGRVLMIIGASIGALTFICALLFTIPQSDVILKLVEIFLGAGTICLGLTLGEGIGPTIFKKDGQNDN